MTKKEMTKKIKDYIATHKEMQGATTLFKDILKAEEELKISSFYIMMVQDLGYIL